MSDKKYLIDPMPPTTPWGRGYNEGIKRSNMPGNGLSIEVRLRQLVEDTEQEIESINAWDDEVDPALKARQLEYQKGHLAGIRKSLKPLADKEKKEHES